MNPLILLFGLLGASAAAAGFGGSNDKSSGKGAGKPTDTTESEPTGAPSTGKNPKATSPDETTPTETTPTETTPQEPAETAPSEPAQTEPVATNTTPEAPTQSGDGSSGGTATDTTPQEPEEPAPSEPAQTEPVATSTTPEAPTQSGDGGSGGATTPTAISAGTVDVMAGRVATIDPAEDVSGVRIVSGVDHGKITVNPDNTFSLVMTQSDFIGTQSFTYEATHADGSTSLQQVTLNVMPGAQDGGWGTGEKHYMLETDADGKVMVEHGEVHTKVYISGSSSALSLSDIAALEGISVSEVTGAWLAAHGGYGQSEDMALAEDAGMAMWNHVTPMLSETSNWLLLERGYEYNDLGRLLENGANGESEMNPLFVGAWGEGEAPNVTEQFFQYHHSSSNLVVQDIHFSDGVFFLDAENVIFDNIKVTGDEMAVMYSSGITIRNSQFIDHTNDASWDGGAWDAMDDRVQGLYMNLTDGALLEGNFFDHNGWSDTYQTDGSQPPSMFSHNIYLGEELTDITLRDTITMRAASQGIAIRSGGFIEDNVVLDNNVSLSITGGDYDGSGPVGEYTFLGDNLITSGGYKDAEMIGALARGIYNEGQLTTLIDNIVAHMADPNGDEDYKQYAWNGLTNTNETYYDDTIVWNWEGSTAPSPSTVTELNAEGLDPAALDQTTIQLFSAQLLNKPDASIADLADYLRAQADGAFDGIVDADLIIRFFQEGFGIAPDIRSDAATLRFVPNDLAEGVRWDNRLNWDTEDLPGLHAADSVDLGGNDVTYGANTTINTLDTGPDGSLNVYGGKLTLTGGITGEDSGSLNIEGAGQLWTEGSDASDLDITISGGRFANTGQFGNADLTATGGQAILATEGGEFDLDTGHTLSVSGGSKAGFDGDDGSMAILDMHEGATLAFGVTDGDLGSIEEFRSGAFGDAPNVQSGIDLGDATLEVDLSGLTASAGTAFTLMDADEIVGLFNDAVVGGLGARNAMIVIDYENDSVTLELSAGNGAVTVQTVGAQDDVSAGNEALWSALTADQGVLSETQAAMVPADEDDIADPLLAA